jgi:hypothetical protein
MTDIDDPHEYVAENRETLVRIVRHGDDQFVRVFGVDGSAERCPECDSWRRLHAGSAAGREPDATDPLVFERAGGEAA